MNMKSAQDIQKATVIGAGTMGHGIAQVLAMCGVEVRLTDVSAEVLEKGLGRVRANLDKGVEKGKVDAAKRDAAVALLSGTTDFDGAIDGVDAVIEAVPERIELKRSLFEKLGDALGPEVLLATNTSSLPITDIAQAAKHPERVTGMHFFNPVHIMKLLEIITPEAANPEVVARVQAFGARIGKRVE